MCRTHQAVNLQEETGSCITTGQVGESNQLQIQGEGRSQVSDLNCCELSCKDLFEEKKSFFGLYFYGMSATFN